MDLYNQMYILDPVKFSDPKVFEAQFEVLKYNPKDKKSHKLKTKLPHTTKLQGNKFLFQTYNILNGSTYVMEPSMGDPGSTRLLHDS